MSHHAEHDPLTTQESLRTIGNWEPTPEAMAATRVTGVPSRGAGSYRPDLAGQESRDRAQGHVYISSSATGRHRVTGDTGDRLYGVYAWSFLLVTLGALFVVSLALDLHAPPWLALTLASAPGVCLVALGVFTVIIVRRCRCECGGWKRAER